MLEGKLRESWLRAGAPVAALLLNKGTRNLRNSTEDEALDDFDAALLIDPTYMEAYNRRAMARAALFIAAAAYDREESRGGHFRSDFPGPVPTLAHRSRLTVTELRTIVNAVLAGAGA